MIEQLSLAELLASISSKLKQHVKDITILEFIPITKELPLIGIEMLEIESVHSEQMWKDEYKFCIHGWIDTTADTKPILELSETIQKAMTTALVLPNKVNLIRQKSEGVQQILEEENMYHVILGYSLIVSQGFKTKI